MLEYNCRVLSLTLTEYGKQDTVQQLCLFTSDNVQYLSLVQNKNKYFVELLLAKTSSKHSEDKVQNRTAEYTALTGRLAEVLAARQPCGPAASIRDAAL